ncbi:hypothetical protein SAMN05518672_101167 [Chitinophaga sp. CF118]|uniref:hypothetical protein n=1 Tax=Chitinophaga sp. CF118 TaxID=1884367 RepID=UPI0008F1B77C|nr:hypothetical protein [Chitinophaga sp. CF118]SFD04026.1 hypothetical protein SAMN05518672_101167 [Chitinophaga sp. CF118]
MKTFGIIAEGPTDQIVIQNILVGFYDNVDLTPNIKFLQPLRDTTDTIRGQGGWFKVFEYCQSQYFLDALEQNDFLIIQIDSDVCADKHFNVSRTNEAGKTKADDVLISDIINRFQEIFIATFGKDKYDQFKDRLIYAICLDEIECWLLPIYYTDKTRSATNNCIHKLNKKIDLQLDMFIDPANKNNMTQQYWKISKPYMKNKTLLSNAYHNISLGKFIDALEEKDILLEEEKGN